MILRQLSLDNFGLYREKVTLDLAPRRRHGSARPVVLVGGKNGAGKTTLLEAIRLALYGKRALGTRVSQEEYDDYLRSRIHRPLDGSQAPTGAGVGLIFDYAEEGRVRTYEVQRSWRARGRSVVESLIVQQDGELVGDVPREEWHFFLEELIPSGVSQLFFFDGEKIQEMAAGEHDEAHLADAIRGLLGIELVSRLRNDLGLYLARQSRSGGDRTAADLERVTRDLDVLDEQLRELHEAVAHMATRRESEARSAEKARHRFVAEGGEVAARRGAIEAELNLITERISKRELELRDLANGHLVFTVAPKLTRPILLALREASDDVDARTKKALSVQLRHTLKLWKAKSKLVGAPRRTASWTAAHWTDIQSFLRYWGATNPREVEEGFALTGAERGLLFERLLHAEQTTRPRLEAIANALDRATVRQRELQASLLKADATSHDALLDELQLAEQRLGAVSATLALREEEFARLRGQRVTLERERRRILDLQARTEQDERRSQLAARSIAALGTYERQLLQSKLEIVRREFLKCFRHLARKTELVKDVRIDPTSFSVTLIDSADHEMPKAALSAGEKQVYATAMLWALARASGRPLPMLIDTPLARLDSTHREALLTRYFPTASHQVILLSTDTEIDADAALLLAPSVSHALRLEYDATAGATHVERGYFWPHSESVSDNALLEASSIS
jgi:DNA sulfur modification protein DndD